MNWTECLSWRVLCVAKQKYLFEFAASAVISVVFLKETVRASDIVGKYDNLERIKSIEMSLP